MSMPSIRECMQRLDAMADTPALIESIDQLNRELWHDEPAWELTRASERMRNLHRLAQQLLAYVRNVGTPPAPPPGTPKGPAISVHDRSNGKPGLATWTEVRTAQNKYHGTEEPPRPAAAKQAQRPARVAPDGMVGVPEFAERLGVTRSRFYALVSQGRLPTPDHGGGRSGCSAFWLEASVARSVETRRPAKPSAAAAA
jgi:predicted DNA-binding transcriptional regulator AlpA